MSFEIKKAYHEYESWQLQGKTEKTKKIPLVKLANNIANDNRSEKYIHSPQTQFHAHF